MQSSSLLCLPNSVIPSRSPHFSRLFSVSFGNGCISSVVSCSCFCFCRVPTCCLRLHKRTLCSLHSSGIVKTSPTESEFVEVGYIYSVHGLRGEVRVKHNTDFPELRFSKPGTRWLRQRVSGREAVQEVELLVGRGHPGQKSWIVSFREFDTVDKAQQLVGSTILVKEEDRPELEEGEFYTRDLVGMRVILKETNEPVGTVVNVYNSGASDLLHVLLDFPRNLAYGTGKTKTGNDASAPLAWVPFVETIVPDVDMDKREMLITPPKGLLELNLRSDERSKKERRQLEWKERKKFHHHLIASKKKLSEMEQKHVFDGLRFGEKAQRRLLADQIVDVNSKLLQHALKNVEVPSNRWNFQEFFKDNLRKQMRSSIVTPEGLLFTGNGKKIDSNSRMQEKGYVLTSGGKVAVVLVIDKSIEIVGSEASLIDSRRSEGTSCPLLENLLVDDQGLVQIEERTSVPLILVCPAYAIGSLQKLFSENDYFAFDSEKVWFLEEETLPVVGFSVEEQNRHKILMKSPWEMLQSPVGSGGVVSLFSSQSILEGLEESGVEYIEVRGVNERQVSGHTLLSLVNSCGASVGIQVYKDTEDIEKNFEIIFSMKFMKKLTKQMDKLHFQAIPKLSSYMKLVDKEWVNVIPSSPNSYEFHCSIYSSLNACPPSKVCVVEVTE